MENTALFPLNFLKCTCIEQYIRSSAESILNSYNMKKISYNMKLLNTVMVNRHKRFTEIHSDTQRLSCHVCLCVSDALRQLQPAP